MVRWNCLGYTGFHFWIEKYAGLCRNVLWLNQSFVFLQSDYTVLNKMLFFGRVFLTEQKKKVKSFKTFPVPIIFLHYAVTVSHLRSCVDCIENVYVQEDSFLNNLYSGSILLKHIPLEVYVCFLLMKLKWLKFLERSKMTVDE